VNHSSQTLQVILVTGSSSGIGEAVCSQLSVGRHIYGASRTETVGGAWSFVKMDVTSEASVQEAVQSLLLREGRIDAVVHCAGTSLAGPVEETTYEEALQQFETNYFGTVRLLRAVLPIMRNQGYGRVIVIGSIGGLIGLPYLAHYSATKFALDGLIEAVRLEVLPFGVYVSVVHPGNFNTRLAKHRTYRQTVDPSSAYSSVFETAAKFYKAEEDRARSPEVLARRIERLLSIRKPAVRYVFGEPLEVAGLWAKSILPSNLFEFLFCRLYLT
jgi:NAD(P)-dependent dehydrogenase (short-subunit alcohol dehydrogenase family)